MGQMLIFGLGYTAKRIKAGLEVSKATGEWQVRATGSDGDIDFGDAGAVRAALGEASHVLSSVPPDRESGLDPVLSTYGSDFGASWYGYLSSTGVYGDAQGAWVDESAPTVGFGGEGRRTARSEADAKWLELGARVFRLPGIYGPGRSALDRVKGGKARRIDLPGQVFSRVHADDIAAGVIAAIESGAPEGAYNLSDDLPCSQNAVIEEACRLLGVESPVLQSLEEANLTPMARGFYAENRRVANGKAKRVLDWQPEYPTYREGLGSLFGS